jgi:hypothetical protein
MRTVCPMLFSFSRAPRLSERTHSLDPVQIKVLVCLSDDRAVQILCVRVLQPVFVTPKSTHLTHGGAHHRAYFSLEFGKLLDPAGVNENEPRDRGQ